MIDVVCDLDGVIYRGDTLIPGADDGLNRLVSAGVNLLYATNNSTRTQDEVAAKIRSVAGVDVAPHQIVTSSQAAASTISPSDGPVFVVGESGIREALTADGIQITRAHQSAGVVVVGLCRDLSYTLLSDASNAVRVGARFIATNTDPTFPTADGLAPGAGSIVAAVAAASGREPETVGKPHLPMRALIRAIVGSNVWVIGDRIDTDMEMAALEPTWRSVLVLTGVTAHGDAGIDADHVTDDLRTAVDLVLDVGQRQ